MHAWEQIQKTVDYIDTHISEEINIDDLAKLASLSQFYYQRLFSRLVKKPVKEYIKLRRLARASDALLEKNKRILDVALDFGFSSHETFTRSFKDVFGMTPEEYRSDPIRLNKFIRPQLMLNYTLIDENVPLVVDNIVIEITRQRISAPRFFIGLTIEEHIDRMPGGSETGINNLGKLWDAFHKNKSDISELKKNGEELGVAFSGTKKDSYRYFAGAETMFKEVPEGYTSWKLPKGEYIVCSFEAEDFEHLITDTLFKAHKYLFSTWIPHHKLRVRPFAAERYTSHNADTTCMEIWLLIEDEDIEQPPFER